MEYSRQTAASKNTHTWSVNYPRCTEKTLGLRTPRHSLGCIAEMAPRNFRWVRASGKRDRILRALACALNGCCSGGNFGSTRIPAWLKVGQAFCLPASRAQAGKMPVPLSSGLSFRQLAPKSSPIFGSLSLKNCPCLPGPAGPPIASRSASEPRERRHRSLQKQRPAPGGAQDRSAEGAPWFSGPAGAGTLVGRDRGRSQSLAAARLTISAPSGSESAPRAMRNFGSFG